MKVTKTAKIAVIVGTSAATIATGLYYLLRDPVKVAQRKANKSAESAKKSAEKAADAAKKLAEVKDAVDKKAADEAAKKAAEPKKEEAKAS